VPGEHPPHPSSHSGGVTIGEPTRGAMRLLGSKEHTSSPPRASWGPSRRTLAAKVCVCVGEKERELECMSVCGGGRERAGMHERRCGLDQLARESSCGRMRAKGEDDAAPRASHAASYPLCAGAVACATSSLDPAQVVAIPAGEARCCRLPDPGSRCH